MDLKDQLEFLDFEVTLVHLGKRVHLEFLVKVETKVAQDLKVFLVVLEVLEEL